MNKKNIVLKKMDCRSFFRDIWYTMVEVYYSWTSKCEKKCCKCCPKKQE